MKVPIPVDVPVMIHSSFHGLAREGYTPYTFFTSWLSHHGQVLMPAMSWKTVKPGGTFDVRSTPSCTGVLSEYFRLHYATHRTLHPTHSICSTYEIQREWWREAWIMMLGIGMDCCTLLHDVEREIAPDKYFETELQSYTVIDWKDVSTPMTVRPTKRLPRDYWLVQDALAEQGYLHTGQIGSVLWFAFPAEAAYRLASQMLRTNPRAFLDSPRYRMM